MEQNYEKAVVLLNSVAGHSLWTCSGNILAFIYGYLIYRLLSSIIIGHNFSLGNTVMVLVIILSCLMAHCYDHVHSDKVQLGTAILHCSYWLSEPY